LNSVLVVERSPVKEEPAPDMDFEILLGEIIFALPNKTIPPLTLSIFKFPTLDTML
jgi:hypothetical protein